jgi:hypothetical protein
VVSPAFLHRQQRLLALAALALGSSGAPGCRTSCDDADPTVEQFSGGQVDASGTSYQSTNFDGHYLKFPPKKVYEFTHHLRAKPFIVVPYVAFSACPYLPRGTCPDDDEPSGQAAVAAGDLAPITQVNATSFRVTNNTCETFYLRVAAYAGSFAEASDGDGGSGGGS